jgi:hypothetical protein
MLWLAHISGERMGRYTLHEYLPEPRSILRLPRMCRINRSMKQGVALLSGLQVHARCDEKKQRLQFPHDATITRTTSDDDSTRRHPPIPL